MAERYFSLGDVKEKWFPSRSLRWIKDTFRALFLDDSKSFPVMRDGGGWLISEKAVTNYQARHELKIIPLRSSQRNNLRQFHTA